METTLSKAVMSGDCRNAAKINKERPTSDVCENETLSVESNGTEIQTEAVRRLSLSAEDVNVLDSNKNTPSHLYATVINKNGSADRRNSFGRTQRARPQINSVDFMTLVQEQPFYLAAENGQADVLDNLFKRGIYDCVTFSHNEALLHVAYDKIYDRMSVVSNESEIQTSKHPYALCEAKELQVMRDEELKKGEEKNEEEGKQPDGEQEQPFYLAAKTGQADVLDELLERGIYDFVTFSDNETPLHVAVKKQHINVVEVILKHRCRIYDKLTKNKQTLQTNCKKFFETRCNMPIDLIKNDGRRVLAEIIWAEIDTPLEVIRRHPRGYTALDLAVKSIQPEMVKLLLSVDQCVYSKQHLRRSFCNMIDTIGVSDSRFEDSTQHPYYNDISVGYELRYTKIKEIAHALMNSSRFDVNHQDYSFNTLLHFVVRQCTNCFSYDFAKHSTLFYVHSLQKKTSDEVVHQLLKNGADFNMTTNLGETPLIIASEKGCCHFIQTLFDWEMISGIKLDVDAKDQHGATALIKAAEENHVEVMLLLLEHKVSVNLHNYYGFTALHAAVYKPKNWFGLHLFCKDLCKREFGYLDYAIMHFSQQSKEFKNKDAYYTIERLETQFENYKKTALLKEELVKRLLTFNETNVNVMDFTGHTPLDLAEMSSQQVTSETIEALKRRGAIRKFHASKDENPKTANHMEMLDDAGRNPLHLLSLFLISDCLDIEGEKMNTVRNQAFTLMVDSILLKPENFRQPANASDSKGRTPLHYAVMVPFCKNLRDRTLVRVLLDICHNVNAADMYGKTPLHYAEENDEYELLVNRGADESATDKTGHTPKDLRELRESVTINTHDALKLPFGEQALYTSNDFSRLLDTDRVTLVTQLSKRNVPERVRIYSQSRRKESAEEAIWQTWIQNELPSLNRRVSQITPLVKCLMERLADGIKERDARFECKPLLVGSAHEETKCFISGDFDFNFKLIKFSQLCDVFPHPLGPKGYFQLRRRRENTESRQNDEDFACFFNLDQCLLTNEVNSRFKIILENVLDDINFWQDEQHFEWNVIDRYKSLFEDQTALCKNVHLRMINPIPNGEGGFLFVNVSIDVVACIHFEDLWLGDELPVVIISPSLKAGGCTLVFGDFEPSASRSIFSDTYTRISFSPLESRIIEKSSDVIKAAYMVCKLIIFGSFKSTNQLKTSLLFCMEALMVREGCEKKDEDKVTKKQLSFWVERLMFCFMELTRHEVYPCYFMPSFRQPVEKLRRNHFYDNVEPSEDEKVRFSSRKPIPFSYPKIFNVYLDLCPDNTEVDIPLIEDEDRRDSGRFFSTQDPRWEQFDREEFIGKLSSRSATY